MLRTTKGNRTLGSRSYRVGAGGSATVSVKPTRRGQRTITRARKHRLTVELTPSVGQAVTKELTLRR